MRKRTLSDTAIHDNSEPRAEDSPQYRAPPHRRGRNYQGQRTELSIPAQIFMDYWSLFGGSHNLINREDEEVGMLLENTADQFKSTISRGVNAPIALFSGTGAVFNLVLDFLQRGMYTSSTALRKYFPGEYEIIKAHCPVPKGSGLEAAEKDMPFDCQNGLMCILKEVIEDRCFTFIKATNPGALEDADIHSAAAFEISQDNWIHFFKKVDGRQVFHEIGFQRLMTNAKEVRNMAAHNHLVTTRELFNATETTTMVLQKLGGVLGEQESPYRRRLVALRSELQTWDHWSKYNKIDSLKRLRALIAALDADKDKKKVLEESGNPFREERKKAQKASLSLQTQEKRWDERAEVGAAFFKYAAEMLKGGPMKKFLWPHYHVEVVDLTGNDSEPEGEEEEGEEEIKRGVLSARTMACILQGGEITFGAPSSHKRARIEINY